MRKYVYTAFALAAFGVVAGFSAVTKSQDQVQSMAQSAEPGVKLVEGFYQISPPPGVDEAFVVTPVRQKAANGTTMIELATADPDDEEVLVLAPRPHSALSQILTAMAGR